MTILLKGKNGEAYNISDSKSDLTLKELASLIAFNVKTKVTYQMPDSIEFEGYSKATKAIMDSRKLQNLGWKAHWTIESGIRQTINYLS